MSFTFTVPMRGLLSRGLWSSWLLSLLLLVSRAFAQAAGDYRSVDRMPVFGNKSGWEKWNGTSWVPNADPLVYSAPFYVNDPVSATFSSTTSRNSLPVSLVAFRASLLKGGKDVQLTWRTAQEKECAGFEVQASADGINYQVLHYYRGQGTVARETNYAHQHLDAFASGGKLRYYRLRQLDTNGEFHFSPVVTVEAAGSAAGTVKAWPVPTTDWLNINLTDKGKESVTVRVLDAAGRVIQTQQYLATETPGTARLHVAPLQRGLYFVQVETKERSVQVRFQKQ